MKAWLMMVGAVGIVLAIFPLTALLTQDKYKEAESSQLFFQRDITGEKREEVIQQWLPCNFYEEASFQKSVAQAQVYPNEGKMKVGIIPHHLLANVQIASFFQTASKESYDTIVMLSTTHFTKTEGILTAKADWKTPFGMLKNDADLTQRFLQTKAIGVKNDMASMVLDHGNAGLIPYVKYYFPKVQIVNLLVSPSLSVQKENALVDALLSINQEKKMLVIASIDFSHYLSAEEARKMDRETERAVETFQLEVLNQYGDEHLDSPKCMRIVLKYLQRIGIQQLNQLDHLSSDQLLPVAENHPVFMEGTTSYFIYSGNEK